MPNREDPERVRRSPIARRSFVLRAILRVLPLGVLLSAGSAGASEPDSPSISETDVIRFAREHAPAVAVARAEADAAVAQERGVGLYPNPSLSWAREAVPGDIIEAETEDFFELTIPIDLSGTRNAERALARSEAESARAVAARNESGAVSDALRLYYGAIGARRLVHIVEQRLGYLEEAARILTSRKTEGRVAGYEEAWIQVELDLAQGDLAEAEADAEAARLELGAVLGRDPATLRLPLRIDVSLRVVATDTRSERPAIQRALASVDEARAARESAGTAWLPVISATGGAKLRTTDETRWGYIVGVELDVPIFSNGQGVRADAAARTQLAKAALTRERTTTRMELARAEIFLARTANVLERFDEKTAAQVERLVLAVESGYREGHRTIIELLQSQQAFARAEERRLELVLARKRAEIALRAAMGEFE